MSVSPHDTTYRTPDGGTVPSRRRILATARRIVVKIGSSSLSRDDGCLDLNRLDQVAGFVCQRLDIGQQVMVVTSGAISAGIVPLGLTMRPRDLPTAQACAAMGQGLLMARWKEAFQSHRHQVAQILLTVEDVMRRNQYTNAHQALDKLLNLGIVPIVNENDAVATDEIRFGDNDRLAALTSHMIQADVLILATDVDGLYTAPPSDPAATKIDVVTDINNVDAVVSAKGSTLGTGGMVTKLEAARIASSAGIPVILCSADDIDKALEGDEVGTLFVPSRSRRPSRLLWLAFAAQVRGKVSIDKGAYHAITDGKSSLLAAGVSGVQGYFSAGDVISVLVEEKEVARGISGYSSHELSGFVGKSSNEIRQLGVDHVRPVIHRDDLAIRNE
ncbi:MAG: glutamate 5-kinase [Actinomycetaceae bacterium]|nr:glutamate 5-kinase [Actinomycetaceae bacterium]